MGKLVVGGRLQGMVSSNLADASFESREETVICNEQISSAFSKASEFEDVARPRLLKCNFFLRLSEFFDSLLKVPRRTRETWTLIEDEFSADMLVQLTEPDRIES